MNTMLNKYTNKYKDITLSSNFILAISVYVNKAYTKTDCFKKLVRLYVDYDLFTKYFKKSTVGFYGFHTLNLLDDFKDLGTLKSFLDKLCIILDEIDCKLPSGMSSIKIDII